MNSRLLLLKNKIDRRLRSKLISLACNYASKLTENTASNLPYFLTSEPGNFPLKRLVFFESYRGDQISLNIYSLGAPRMYFDF